jgi:hypothetical protein
VQIVAEGFGMVPGWHGLWETMSNIVTIMQQLQLLDHKVK